MSLHDLINDSTTDKNTTHSYLELYESLLCTRKHTATHVLEIGIGDFQDKNGGSIKLWRDYFPNATIYGLDILPGDRIIDEIMNDERVILYTSTDAYDETFFTTNFLEKNLRFDFLLDDGPHSIESMKTFIKLYSQLMTEDAILIIEDIQSWDWIQILTDEVPDHLKCFINVYDLRNNKGRYDDIVFTIDKTI